MACSDGEADEERAVAVENAAEAAITGAHPINEDAIDVAIVNEAAVNEELPVNDPRNRVRWGEFTGVQQIATEVQNVHNKITTWQKNIFELPRNAAISKDMIAEATRLVTLFNSKSAMESIAIPLLTIFLPLMLQKPSQKSKKADHIRNLKRRLAMWKEGKLKELLSECAEIQKRLKNLKAVDPQAEAMDNSEIPRVENIIFEGH